MQLDFYGLDLGGTNWTSSCGGEIRGGPTAAAESLVQLVLDDCRERGVQPDAMALAVPGDGKGDIISIANIPQMRQVSKRKTSEQLGRAQMVAFLNDLQTMAFALTGDVVSTLPLLWGTLRGPGMHVGALTSSTGTNWCVQHPAVPPGMPREGGHTLLAIPDYGNEAHWRLINGLEHLLRHPLSVEDVISGRGVTNLARICNLTKQVGASDAVRELIIRQAAAGTDCAPLMTRGAASNDPFWVNVARLYGRTLAYVIYNLAVDNLIDTLAIQGGVLMGEAGFAEWLFAQSNVVEPLHGLGMEKDAVVKQLLVYGVPGDRHLAAHGAETYARMMYFDR